MLTAVLTISTVIKTRRGWRIKRRARCFNALEELANCRNSRGDNENKAVSAPEMTNEHVIRNMMAIHGPMVTFEPVREH